MNSPSPGPPEDPAAEAVPETVPEPSAGARREASAEAEPEVPAGVTPGVPAAAPVDLLKHSRPSTAEQAPPIWAIGPAAVSNGNGDVAPGPDWVAVIEEPVHRTTPRDWLLEVVAALAVAVVLTGLGAALAYVWAEISPRTVVEMTADGVVYTEPNPEGYVAGESVYLIMTAGLGVVTPIVVWMLVRRRRGPILLTGLAVGSVAGATLMAWLGARIGLAEYRELLAGAPVGTRFEIPVKVYSAIIDFAGFKIQGAVLVQAMIAVAIYTFLAGFYPTASLRPERATITFAPPPGMPPQPDADNDPGTGEQPEAVNSGWPVPSDPRAAPAPPVNG